MTAKGKYRWVRFLCAILVAFQFAPNPASAHAEESNILIAYFAVAENSEVDAISSASALDVNGKAKGLVRILADSIAENTGGELFAIQTSVAYPGNIGTLIDYASVEQNQSERPELISQIDNLDTYDTVFIGYPIWWYDLPMVMYSFFDAYDFSGKTIVPFSTHNGSQFSGTINTIAELEPDATTVTDGFTIHMNAVGNAGDDLSAWLESIGF